MRKNKTRFCAVFFVLYAKIPCAVVWCKGLISLGNRKMIYIEMWSRILFSLVTFSFQQRESNYLPRFAIVFMQSLQNSPSRPLSCAALVIAAAFLPHSSHLPLLQAVRHVRVSITAANITSNFFIGISSFHRLKILYYNFPALSIKRGLFHKSLEKCLVETILTVVALKTCILEYFL